MAENEIATAYVSIVPTTVGMRAALTGQVVGPATTAGTTAGAGMGKGITAGMLPVVRKAAVAVAGVLAAVGVAKFAAASIETFKNAAGEVVKLQRVAGGTAEEMSRFRFAAKASGVEVGTFTKGLTLFGRNLTTATQSGDATAKMIQQLGFDFRDANGQILPMSELLPKVADRFESMPNGAEKTALAMKLFGRAGADLIPFLNKGSKGLAELAKQSDKFGQTLNQKMVEDFLAARKNTRDWNLALEGLKIQIGAKLLPILTKLSLWFTEKAIPAIQTVGEAFVRLTDGTASTGEKLTAIAVAAGPIALILAKIIPVVAMVVKAFGAFGLVSNPVGWVVLAIGAVIGALVLLWNKSEGFRSFVEGVWKGLQKIGQAIADFWSGTVAPIVSEAWEQIKKTAQETWIAIRPTLEQWKAKAAELVAWWVANWPQIQATIQVLWDQYLRPFISWMIGTGIPAIGWLVTAWVNGFSTMVNFMRPAFVQAMTVITLLWRSIEIATNIITTNFKLIASVTSVVWSGIRTAISVAVNVIKTTLGSIAGAVSGVIAAFTGLYNGIKSKMTDIGRKVSDIKDTVTGALKGAASWLYGTGESVVKGLISGIGSLKSSVTSALLNLLPEPLRKFAGKLGINSPSKVFAGFGENVGQGFTSGIDSTLADVEAATTRLAATSLAGFDPGSLAPTITPAAMTIASPKHLVIVDADGALIGRMKVAADQALDGLADELLYRNAG